MVHKFLEAFMTYSHILGFSIILSYVNPHQHTLLMIVCCKMTWLEGFRNFIGACKEKALCEVILYAD